MRCAVVTPDPTGVGGIPTIARITCELVREAGWEPESVFVSSLSAPRLSLRHRSAMAVPTTSALIDSAGRPIQELRLLSVLPETEIVPLLASRARLRDPRIGRRWDVAVITGGPVFHGWMLSQTRLPYIVWVASGIDDERVGKMQDMTRLARWYCGKTLPLLRRYENAVLARAQRIFAMSTHTARTLQALHPGIEPQVLFPPMRSCPHWNEQDERLQALEQREIRLIFVGRINDTRKRFGDCLEICERLAERHPDSQVVLMVTANASEFNGWRRHMRAQTRLIGHPTDEDLTRYLRSAHYLVLTSEQEGFGLVAAEAMKCGTPVLTTPSGGPEEMVIASRGGRVGIATELVNAAATALSRATFWHGESQRVLAYAERSFRWDVAVREFRAALMSAQASQTP